MSLRLLGTQVWGAWVLSGALILGPLATLASYAQVNRKAKVSHRSHVNGSAQVNNGAHASSASHVPAEMTKGKLNSAESKPGDTVVIKLKDDVRSNGEVVVKKGTTLTGVVRSVKRIDSKGELRTESKGQAVSMMEIEWLAPTVQGRDGQSFSFALQLVMQVNPIYLHQQSESSGDDFGLSASGSSSAISQAVARPARSSGGGLLAATEAIGANPTSTTGTTGAVGVTADGVASAGTVISTSSSAASSTAGRSNVALLSMPSVVAVDQQISSNIERTLGTSPSGQLFRVGHGELISAGGSKQSLDLYSHLSNDTVITSPGKNFEISSGAQMQMLVGVNRK